MSGETAILERQGFEEASFLEQAIALGLVSRGTSAHFINELSPQVTQGLHFLAEQRFEEAKPHLRATDKFSTFTKEAIHRLQLAGDIPRGASIGETLEHLIPTSIRDISIPQRYRLALAHFYTHHQNQALELPGMGELTADIAAQLGYGGWQREVIGLSGLMHDIGKIIVPQELFDKKDITHRERNLIRRHPRYSRIILDREYEHHQQTRHTLIDLGFPRSIFHDPDEPQNIPELEGAEVHYHYDTTTTQRLSSTQMYHALVGFLAWRHHMYDHEPHYPFPPDNKRQMVEYSSFREAVGKQFLSDAVKILCVSQMVDGMVIPRSYRQNMSIHPLTIMHDTTQGYPNDTRALEIAALTLALPGRLSSQDKVDVAFQYPQLTQLLNNTP